MKTELNEWGKENLEIILTPETIEECSKLLRYSLNALAEKPRVNIHIENDFTCYINLRKFKKSIQKLSINPDLKYK